MLKLFSIVLCCINCISDLGQVASELPKKGADTLDLDKITFTKTQIMPKLKDGPAALEDTLESQLSRNNTHFKEGRIYFGLVIGRTGIVKEVSRQVYYDEKFKLEGQIIDILKNSSGMWIPAQYNGKSVNAYTLIWIDFNRKTLKVYEKY